MNNRGQAALEYLMTYGWALIVIAIVVGVLVFIVSSPAGNIVCNSDDPAKVMVKASKIETTAAAAATLGDIKITNLTGGDMTSVLCTGDGLAFEGAVTGCSTTVTSGAEITLQPTGGTTSTTPYSTAVIKMKYTDYASLDRNATITCSGPITVT